MAKLIRKSRFPNDKYLEMEFDSLLAQINKYIDSTSSSAIGSFDVRMGHDHNGLNSKKVNHTDLINAGSNAHSVIDTHLSNTTIHITATERTNWNTAYSQTHTHSNKTDLDGITSTLIGNWNTAYSNRIQSVTAPITFVAGALGSAYNTTNLKLTINELNTIQDITTASNVQFGSVKTNKIIIPTNGLEPCLSFVRSDGTTEFMTYEERTTGDYRNNLYLSNNTSLMITDGGVTQNIRPRAIYSALQYNGTTGLLGMQFIPVSKRTGITTGVGSNKAQYNSPYWQGVAGTNLTCTGSGGFEIIGTDNAPLVQYVTLNSTGTLTMIGNQTSLQFSLFTHTAGTVNAYGFYYKGVNQNLTAAKDSNKYAFHGVMGGTGLLNVGAYFGATGATNNYALITSTGKIAINQISTLKDFGISGQTAYTFGMDRHTTADTLGVAGTWTLSGGATLSATDKNGGKAILETGRATGDGGTEIGLYNVKTGQGAGTTDRLPIEQVRVADTTMIGDIAGGNYTNIEEDGTIKFIGNATVYDDLDLEIAPKTTGAGKPTLTTFTGNIQKYTFAVGDITELRTAELLHKWKEGSAIEIHIHWATNGNNDATVRGVKWEVDYTWANMEGSGGTIVFADATTLSAETSIAANEVGFTHKYTSVLTFTPTGGKVGAALCMSLKRIASVTNVAPANNPFCLMVGAHIQIDTCGSRTISTK